MRDKLRLGIIGCGRISYAHRDACRILGDEAVITAAADVDEERVSKFCEGIEAVRRFTSHHDLLKCEDVDAAIICLPHSLHREVALEAVQAGRHVLVEKPMALSAVESAEMTEAADRAQKTLMVGQCRRFSHAAIEMKARIDRGEIGELFRIVLNFLCFFDKAPTPWWNEKQVAGDPLVIILQGSHAIDEILWLFGRMPTHVHATRFRRRFSGDDESDIVLDFGNATAAAHLSLNTKPPLIHDVLAIGTQGVLRLSESLTGKPFGFGYKLELNGETLQDGPQEPSNFALQLREFVRSIQEDREPVASGRDVGSTTMRVLSAAVESASSRSIVTL